VTKLTMMAEWIDWSISPFIHPSINQ